MSSGALDAPLLEELERARSEGCVVSLGPFLPAVRDDLRPLERAPHLEAEGVVPLLVPSAPTALAATVSAAVEALGLGELRPEPEGVVCTVRRDVAAQARVVFAINTRRDAIEARLPTFQAAFASDALSREVLAPQGDRFELRLPPLGVRMLELGAPAAAVGTTSAMKD